MGIVVCLAMLLGLVQLITRQALAGSLIAWLLVVLGAWNALWYGLRHIGEFWGWAALISGVFMVMSGVLIAAQSGKPELLIRLAAKITALRLFVIVGLFASFLLYAVTLIRLNMGLSIIH